MAVVSSIADVERVLALGVPCVVDIRGAESVRAAARMMELMGPILPAGASDGTGDGSGNGDTDVVAAEVGHGGAWILMRVDRLRSFADLADHLLELTNDVVPALAHHPADTDLLRRLNEIGKRVRKAGKELRGFGLSLPQDAGALASTLGNKIRKMVSRAFNERGSGTPRSGEDRGRYVSPRRENLLDQINEVLDVARVRF